MSQKLLITAYSHTSHSPSNFGKKKKFKLFVKRKVLIQTYLFFLMADQSVPILNWRVVRNLKSMVLLLLGLCLLVKLSPTCMFNLRANIIYKIVAHPKNCETFKSHRHFTHFIIMIYFPNFFFVQHYTLIKSNFLTQVHIYGRGHGNPVKSTGPPRPASASSKLIITAMAASSFPSVLTG